MASCSVSFWLLFIAVHTADGFMHYSTNKCLFNSTELEDIEFVSSYYYNRLEYVRFSSSLGKFVGYTEFGVKNAERWNKDPAEMSRMRAQKEIYCQPNIGVWYSRVLSKSAQPYVVLHSTAPPSKSHPAVLVCSVHDFYPRPVLVSWFRDEEKVTSGVTSTGVMQNGDWYYQIHSRLEYTPRSGEKISCVVEHASLEGPLRIYWDPSMSRSDRVKIVIGVSALIVGLIVGAAGFIYYRSRTQDVFLLESEKSKIAIRASGLTLDQVLSLARFIYDKKNPQGRILAPQ